MNPEEIKKLYEEAREIAAQLNLELEPFTLSELCDEAERERIQSLATYLFYRNGQIDLHRELNDPQFNKRMAEWFEKEMKWEKRAMGWV